MRRRRYRRWHTAAAVAGSVVAVILSPVLLPIALLLHARDETRMRALADHFACLSCGGILGADLLRLADEAWSAHMAELTRGHGDRIVRFRVEKRFDAICANCGTYHKFVPKDRTFILARREEIPPKPAEQRPQPTGEGPTIRSA